jgi:hypothetical protein
MIVTRDTIKEPNQLKVVFTFEEVETPDGFTRYTDAIYLPVESIDLTQEEMEALTPYKAMAERLVNWIGVCEQIKENQRIDAEERAKALPDYILEFGRAEGFDEWFNNRIV